MEDKIILKTAEHFGTPLYIYDQENIIEQIHRLKDILPKSSRLFYSLKANPLVDICKIMNDNQCGAEVASVGEIKIALKSGILPENIIFTGPGKTKQELLFAIQQKIRCINIESVEEAIITNELAELEETNVKIAVRVNPNVVCHGSKIKMSGISSQFGIDETVLDESIEMIKKLQYVKLIGFQIYAGTQNLQAKDIIDNTKYCFQIANEYSKKHDLNLEYINMGGGFGVPYFQGETELDDNYLRGELKKLFEDENTELENIDIIFESGRFLVARSGEFVTKILYKKECKENIYLVCDGGSNCQSSAAFLGRYVRNNFPMRLVSSTQDGAERKEEKVTIVGPLCTPTDIIGQKVTLKEAHPGDYIVIENSGAYGLTHSPVMFLSHEPPKEVLYKQDLCSSFHKMV